MRVVAVSAETSLAAALNMMDGWEVVFAREGEDVGSVAAGAAVVLAGGGTERGLQLIESLRASGVDVPAIVLGDADPPEGAGSTVLRPPFTLDELRAAVEDAVRVGYHRPKPAEQPAPPQPDPPTPASPTRELSAGSQPPAPTEAVRAPATSSGNGAGRFTPDVAEISGPRDSSTEPPAEPSALDASPPSPPEPRSDQEPSEVATTQPPPAVEEHPPAPPIREVEVALDPSTGEYEPLPPERKKRRWRGEREVVGTPVLASQGSDPAPGGSVDAQLHAAAQALRSVEQLLGQMPFLMDLEGLASAVVGEVVEAFSPQIVSLYLASENGFWVAGGHQLTPAERRLTVRADHPLLRELLASKEPMLIAPLDLARATVSGIAGARTEAMIAGPVLAADGCLGVIVVGRDDFQDRDLDTLARLTSEVAPGLAVALALDRLRSRR